MLLCQEEWGPRYRKRINKSLASRFSSTDLEINIIIMLLVTFVNIAYLCISVLIHSYGVLLEAWGWFLPGKSLITIPSNPHRPFRVGSFLILKKYKMYDIWVCVDS